MSRFTIHQDPLYSGRTIYHDAERRLVVVKNEGGGCTAYMQQDSVMFGCSSITHRPVVGLVGEIGTDPLPREIAALPGWSAGFWPDERIAAVEAFFAERKRFGALLIAQAVG